MPKAGFCEQLKNDEAALVLLLKKMGQFDELLCSQLNKSGEFVLRLEARGTNQQLQHVRVYLDDIEKPKRNGRIN